jgi:NADP-dependent 3-hydroxy acid dehydrogenase YdfG
VTSHPTPPRLSAVVTGASTGIGRATARRLAEAGYRVVVAARRLELLRALADEIGGTAVHLDVTDAKSVAALAEQVDACDVLVNCAGGAVDARSVTEAEPADWARSYDINVLGTLRVIQALLPALSRSASASIVTVTSTAALAGYPTGGSYSAAKHAERALMETLRQELCGQPLRVIEIAPGMVMTEEFALNRFGGDQQRAEAVYAGVDRPLLACDIAECILSCLALPAHVNVDRLIVRPLAQAAQHLVARGPIFAST